MASNKWLASWRAITSGNRKDIAPIYPVCDDLGEVPSRKLKECAQRSLQNGEEELLTRVDGVLCLRAIKVVE